MPEWKKWVLKETGRQERPYQDQGAPLPYPQGWHMMAASSDLAPGGIITRRLMGKDVVLYRTRSGLLRAITPHCPHLGAHLGCNSTLEGEDIVCPFHRFAFAPDGTVARPGPGYTGALVRGRLGQYPVRESDGAVFVWGSGTDAMGTPTWEVPQLLPAGMTPPRFTVFDLDGHPQEIGENGVDTGHLRALHGWKDTEILHPPKEEGHHYSIGLRVSRQFPPFGVVSSETELSLYGLGIWRVHVQVPAANLEIVMLVFPRPVEPWRVHLTVGLVTRLRKTPGGWSRNIPQGMLDAVGSTISSINTRAVLRDFALDFPIWSHKAYTSPPFLAKGDGPIGSYRKWCRQFYPEQLHTTEP